MAYLLFKGPVTGVKKNTDLNYVSQFWSKNENFENDIMQMLFGTKVGQQNITYFQTEPLSCKDVPNFFVSRLETPQLIITHNKRY